MTQVDPNAKIEVLTNAAIPSRPRSYPPGLDANYAIQFKLNSSAGL
jgi:hypothetical protein